MATTQHREEEPNLIIHRKPFLFHHPPEETTIDEHYKLGKRVARGGFGDVHVCTHRRTNHKRAVKILPKKHVSSEAFLREINVLKTIDHPNILRLFESFEDDNHYYIVTDLSTGGDLFEYLTEHYETMTERDIAALIKQLLICIGHCHKHGVVHSDLKPENILLELDHDFERLTLCDFGFAQFYSEDARLERCRGGTPEYLAPEVFRRNYGPKCDVWSLGILAYLLLVGQFPFPGKTPRGICIQLKDRQDHFDVEGWSHISAEGKSLVQALLNKDECARPSAEEALLHPWIQNKLTIHENNEASTTNEDNRQTSLATWNHNLIQFSAKQKLKQATYAFIVAQLTCKTRKKLLDEAFRSVDLNGDGRICMRELEASFRQRGQLLSEVELEDIYNRVDIDKNGFISYWEFLAATTNASTMLCAENLRIAFEVFDKSKSDSITAEDLKHLFRDMKCEDGDSFIEESVIEAIIKQVDTNSDGQISFEEFETMMRENIMLSSTKRLHDTIS